jgi:uncharacterized membrane protein YeaQ/YmgE (transglycosylase-associated protein family)
MDILYYFLIAIVIGWVITDLMHNRPSLLFNLLLAVLGAFLAGNFLTPYFHVRTINAPFNLPTLGVTLLGTIILVVIFNISPRGRRNW